MVVFDKEQLTGRVISRKKALGYKELVLNDDVENGDEISIQLEDGKIVIAKVETGADAQVDENGEEPEMNLLLKEFGLFTGYPTRIEVTLCDKYMLVTLINGAIDLRLGGNAMMASRGIETAGISRHNLDEVQWVDVNRLLSFCKFWAGVNEDYPFDYTYVLDVYKGEGKSIILKPADAQAFLYDISNGGLDDVEKRRALKEQSLQAKAYMGMVLTPQSKNHMGVTSQLTAPVEEEEEDEFNIWDYIDNKDDDYDSAADDEEAFCFTD